MHGADQLGMHAGQLSRSNDEEYSDIESEGESGTTTRATVMMTHPKKFQQQMTALRFFCTFPFQS